MMRVIGPHFCVYCDFQCQDDEEFQQHFETLHMEDSYAGKIQPIPFDHKRWHPTPDGTCPDCIIAGLKERIAELEAALRIAK